jgi:hypothetical protein
MRLTARRKVIIQMTDGSDSVVSEHTAVETVGSRAIDKRWTLFDFSSQAIYADRIVTNCRVVSNPQRR